MDLIWGHISTEPMRCPQLKNIGLTLWAIRKTSFLFSGHVTSYQLLSLYVFVAFLLFPLSKLRVTISLSEDSGVWLSSHASFTVNKSLRRLSIVSFWIKVWYWVMHEAGCVLPFVIKLKLASICQWRKLTMQIYQNFINEVIWTLKIFWKL